MAYDYAAAAAADGISSLKWFMGPRLGLGRPAPEWAAALKCREPSGDAYAWVYAGYLRPSELEQEGGAAPVGYGGALVERLPFGLSVGAEGMLVRTFRVEAREGQAVGVWAENAYEPERRLELPTPGMNPVEARNEFLSRVCGLEPTDAMRSEEGAWAPGGGVMACRGRLRGFEECPSISGYVERLSLCGAAGPASAEARAALQDSLLAVAREFELAERARAHRDAAAADTFSEPAEAGIAEASTSASEPSDEEIAQAWEAVERQIRSEARWTYALLVPVLGAAAIILWAFLGWVAGCLSAWWAGVGEWYEANQATVLLVLVGYLWLKFRRR